MLFAAGSFLLSFGLVNPAYAADPPAAPAAPAAQADRHYVLGVDWVPASRADLVWIAEDQLTGTLAGEFDGALRPALTAYGGLQGDKTAWLLSLGVARSTDVSWTLESRETTAMGGVRPALDMQRYLLPRQTGATTAWFGVGVSGVIPLASVRSAAFGEQEAEDAAEEARATRSRIGGVGGRIGLGGEVLLSPGITLGLRTHVNAHRGQTLDEDALRVATWIWADAGLRLQIEL
ncbi:hypothetical protein L6R46_05195 [Myxococcota bacterium]|jgi:hypothetical protein|nr:hypothetical protein [Myxococcota bacterium]